MNLDGVSKVLSEEGCWWFDPWWEIDYWYDTIQITKTDAISAVDFLKSIFTSEWVKSLGENSLEHPFLQLIFFGRGVSQLYDIYELAERYRTVICTEGYKSVLENYKTIKHSRSANFEAFFLNVLKKAGCDVSFITAKPKYGPTPDILVKNLDKEFIVECKCIQESDAEKWVVNYAHAFGNLIVNAAPGVYDVFYCPHQLAIDPYDYGYPEFGSYQLAATIDTLPIVNYLNSIGFISLQDSYIDLGPKGHLYVLPKSIGFPSQTYIPETTSKFVGRRLVQNAIKKANAQISAFGKPGIAAIFYDSPPNIGVLKQELPKIFEEYKEDYALLMGVVIFPAQNLLNYVRPMWISNPFASIAPEDFGLPSLLTEVINPWV